MQFRFPMKKSLNILSSIACSTMIASSKQIVQDHNNLRKTQGSIWGLQESQIYKILETKCKPQQEWKR